MILCLRLFITYVNNLFFLALFLLFIALALFLLFITLALSLLFIALALSLLFIALALSLLFIAMYLGKPRCRRTRKIRSSRRHASCTAVASEHPPYQETPLIHSFSLHPVTQ